MLRYLPTLLVLGLWIFAFIDCLNTPEDEVRGLPKIGWVIVILLFGGVLVGPVAWMIAGRRRRAERPRSHDEGGQRWIAPDDNPEFLRSLRPDKNGDGPQS
ncbi:PLDc N-terminal domain-containing protein [Streptomyces sp. NPDC002537]